MPLTNKYLRYSPEITLEIFTLVWDKLHKEGLKCDTNINLIKCYNLFNLKMHSGFLRMTTGSKIYFYPYTGISTSQTETTVQEILGYDPFVKNDFVLPEKWAIKHSKEVGIWFDRLYYPAGDNVYESTDYKYLHYPRGESAMWNSIKKGYTEITFEQFQKYVLKITEQPKVMESKEVIPEYVECIKYATAGTKVGEVFQCKFENDCFKWLYNKPNGAYTGWDTWGSESNDKFHEHFKPSTKEAFDAQNKPKSIEKWSVGSYVVFLNSKIQSNGFNKGDIQQIREYNSLSITYYSGAGNTVSDKGISEQIKWFATKSEAEEFAKTLVQPIKEVVKQAVHCITQEEWDFVTEKLGNDGENWFIDPNWGNNKSFCISFEDKNQSQTLDFYQNAGYQILSFQEWCDLNNYIMNKKRYTIKELETNSKLLIYIDSKEEHDKIEKVSKRICSYYGNYCYSLYGESYSLQSSKSCPGAYDGDSTILTIDNIIFEDNIKSDKEILNESSIGKYISFNYNNRFYNKVFITKENGYIYLLNNCYSNNNGHSDKSKYKHSLQFSNFNEIKSLCKDIKFLDFEDIKFKPLQPNDLEWEIQVPQIKTHGIMWCEPAPMTKDNGKNKMILSIDDEELPMVSIIKTNSIKQLLNLE